MVNGGGVAVRHLRVKVHTRKNPKYGNSERVEVKYKDPSPGKGCGKPNYGTVSVKIRPTIFTRDGTAADSG